FAAMVAALGGSAAVVVSCQGSDPASGSSMSSAGDPGGGGQAGAGGGDGGGGGSGGGAGNDAVPLSTAPRGAEATAALCSNGIDDDGNGYTDCDDSWCRQTVELTVCDALENTDKLCSDKVDNVESPRIPGQTYK